MSQVGMEWAQGTESVWYGIDAFTALHGNNTVSCVCLQVSK